MLSYKLIFNNELMIIKVKLLIIIFINLKIKNSFDSIP